MIVLPDRLAALARAPPADLRGGNFMGDHFKVEVNDLDRLITELHNSQDDMRKALSALKDVGPKSTGSEALDNACDEFHDSWDNTIKKIADSAQALEERLKQTKNNYEQTEQAIREAFAQAQSNTQPSPSPRTSATPSAPASPTTAGPR